MMMMNKEESPINTNPPDNNGLKKKSLLNSHNAVYELISTEKHYYQSLREIDEGYLDTLSSCEAFKTESLQKVFLAWSVLTKFHQSFTKELEKTLGNIYELASCFIGHEQDFMRNYLDICLNYSNAVDDLSAIESPEALNILQQCQKNLGHALPLTCYLLKPVQRILKYRMLLEVIEKSFTMDLTLKESTHAVNSESLKQMKTNQSYLLKALQTMINVADYMNEKKRMHDLLDHLRLVGLKFDGWGDLLKMNTFRLLGKRDRRLVLMFFNVLVVYKGSFDLNPSLDNSVQTSHTLPFIEMQYFIEFKKLMLTETTSKNPLAFQISTIDDPKMNLTLIADNGQIKNTWCMKIKNLILDHYDVAIPEHARQLVLNMSYSVTQTPITLDESSNKDVKTNKRSSSSSSLRKNSFTSGLGRKIKMTNLMHYRKTSPPPSSPTRADVISEPLDMNGNPVHHFKGCNRFFGSDIPIQFSMPLRRKNCIPLPPLPIKDQPRNNEECEKQDNGQIDFRCIAIEINEEIAKQRQSISEQEANPMIPRLRQRDINNIESLISKRQHRLSVSNKLMTALFNEPTKIMADMSESFQSNYSGSQSCFYDSLTSASETTSLSSSSCQRDRSANDECLDFGQAYKNYLNNQPNELLSKEEIDQILKPIIASSNGLQRPSNDREKLIPKIDIVLSNCDANDETQTNTTTIDEKAKKESRIKRSLSQLTKRINKTCLPNEQIIDSSELKKKLSASHVSIHSITNSPTSNSLKSRLGHLIDALPYVDDSPDFSTGSSHELSEDSAYYTKRTSSLPNSISNNDLSMIQDNGNRIKGVDDANIINGGRFRDMLERFKPLSISKIL